MIKDITSMTPSVDLYLKDIWYHPVPKYMIDLHQYGIGEAQGREWYLQNQEAYIAHLST